MPRKANPLGLTGEALAATAYDLCRLLGLKVAHFRPARIYDPRTAKPRWHTPAQWDGVGWPDMFIADPRGGGVLVREVKGDREAVTPEQRQWLAWLTACGLDAGVWRPADLRSGRIEAELKAIVARRPGRPISQRRSAPPS